MSASFTPGPWAYVDATKEASMQFSPSCVIRGDGKQIAAFSWNDNSPHFPTKDESQANARLIAAAPDLLEALQLADATLRGAHMNRNVVERKVSAALAKAEGE
jgi:hypothetical protein